MSALQELDITTRELMQVDELSACSMDKPDLVMVGLLSNAFISALFEQQMNQRNAFRGLAVPRSGLASLRLGLLGFVL
jgi:hypothetical protein